MKWTAKWITPEKKMGYIVPVFTKDFSLFTTINKDAENLFVLQEHDVEIRKYINSIIEQIDIKNQLN